MDALLEAQVGHAVEHVRDALDLRLGERELLMRRQPLRQARDARRRGAGAAHARWHAGHDLF